MKSEEEIGSFIKDYKKADIMCIIYPRNTTPENCDVRFDDSYDSRIMSIEELFQNLGIDEEKLNSVYKYRHIFGRAPINKVIKIGRIGSWAGRIKNDIFIADGKQNLADILQKHLAFYVRHDGYGAVHNRHECIPSRN